MSDLIQIEMTDEEILDFVKTEQERLGKYFSGFTITYDQNVYDEWVLTLESHGATFHNVPQEEYPLMRFGKMAALATAKQNQCEINFIQKAGRDFYFKWKNNIPNLKRNLAVRKR